MKNVLLYALIFSLFSCQSVTKWLREPSSENQPSAKHYIFTVHGLAGNKTTFGNLLPVLEKHLESVDPKYDVVAKSFVYGTGLTDAEVGKFIGEFEKFLDEFFVEHSLNLEDKISFVTHSQGGLITTLWYVKTLAAEDRQIEAANQGKTLELAESEKRQLAILDQVDSIVTEGTPFWGSTLAYVVNDRFPQFLQYLVFKMMGVSRGEIRELSIASRSIYDSYKKRAEAVFVNLRNPRMLNIAAVVPGWIMNMSPEHYNGFLSRRLNIGNRLESDFAVNVTSARLGFYFYSDTLQDMINEKIPAHVQEKDFYYSQYFGRDPAMKLVESVHTVRDLNYGIAYVPEKCIEAAACDHSTYGMVFQHLSKCSEKNNSCNHKKYTNFLSQLYKNDTSYGKKANDDLMNQMRTFQLGFNIELPKNFTLPPDIKNSEMISKYIRVKYKYGNSKSANRKVSVLNDAVLQREYPFQDYRIQLGRYREYGSRVVKHIPKANLLNIQFSGNVQPTDAYWQVLPEAPDNWASKQFPIYVEVKIPGLKKRTLEVVVKPTFTTFVDLILEKEQ